MNSDLRMQLQIARTAHYGDIMRTTLLCQLGLAAVIGFGVEGVDYALAVLVVAVTAFGAIGGGTALDDIAKLRDDMDEATASSVYGQQAKARNLGLLKTLTMILLGLVGIGEIYAIFA